MSSFEVRSGNDAEYAFGAAGLGWDGAAVVDLHGVEEISRPFHFAITLARSGQGEPLGLDELVGGPASLAIRRGQEPGFFLRHGIVAEAEELERSADLQLYRVVLLPHLARSSHRRRCRTFLDRSLEEVIERVLRNVSDRYPSGIEGLEPAPAGLDIAEAAAVLGDYREPRACFRWDIRDEETRARLRHDTLRRYVVQYNESDLDFVSRLLEEEGISYCFEHAVESVVLCLTDEPGAGSIFDDQRAYRLQGRASGMATGREEVVRSFTGARRLRSRAVTMRDYHWERSGLVLEAQTGSDPALGERSGHFEFPARDEDVLKNPCEHPSRVRAERFESERNLSRGTGTMRALAPGRRFRLEEAAGEEPGGRLSRGDYLAARVETVATQHHFPGTLLDSEAFGFDGRSPREAPSFAVRFTALAAEVRYRPERSTPRPRIDGVQTAVVTDQVGEPASETEIHCDSWARVRVRFPWDQRRDGQPSSKWIRVSQTWAGRGYGAMHVPRVGQEVLVAYLNGDPDNPTIVGRVYNRTNPPPFDAQSEPEVSSLKTQSTPGADGFNELRFDDTAGKERVSLRAQRDLHETVRADHSLDVGGDQAITVAGDRSDSVAGSELHRVSASRTTYVDANETRTVGGLENVTVDEDRLTSIGGKESHEVKGTRGVSVSGDHEIYTKGEVRSISDGGHAFHTGGDFSSSASGDHHFFARGRFSSEAKVEHLFLSPALNVKTEVTEMFQDKQFVARVGDCFVQIGKGVITLNNGAGASLSLVGGSVIVNADEKVTLSASNELEVKSGQIKLNGGQAEKKKESKAPPERKKTIALHVHAHADAEHRYKDTYTLEAADGSFSQSKVPASEGERDENGYTEVLFTDVPPGKKFNVKVERGGKTRVLLQNHDFDG